MDLIVTVMWAMDRLNKKYNHCSNIPDPPTRGPTSDRINRSASYQINQRIFRISYCSIAKAVTNK